MFPWDVTLEPAGSAARLGAESPAATVISLAPLGNRLRVGLAAPQPLSAEVTEAAARAAWRSRPGSRVDAHWKATATRLTPSVSQRPALRKMRAMTRYL